MKLKRRWVTIFSGLLAVATAIWLTGCSSLQWLNASVSHRGYTRTTDLAYGSAARQKLDVYLPKKVATNAPVAIFFYGGAWRAGSKTDYRFVAQALNSRGFIVVLPDYRLYPQVTFPTFVEDGALAVRWVRDNISHYGGATNRIYLMGHSAGAHLAVLLTLDAHYLQAVGLDRNMIRATAALAGPYDFTPTLGDQPVFGLSPNDATIDPKIEPITFADGSAPPLLLLHGWRDKTVNPTNAVNLAARIRHAGGAVAEIYYPPRGHAALVVALVWPYQWLAPVLADVTEYFNRH